MKILITFRVLTWMAFIVKVALSGEDPSTEMKNVTKCDGEMVHRAKIQPDYPNYNYGPEHSERFYDPVQDKCLTKVDQPCPEFNSSCAPNAECRLLRTVYVMMYRRCYCNGSYQGVENGFIANIDKTYCGRKGYYGNDCSTIHPHVACDPKERLDCHDNKCACQDPLNMVYDEKARKCRSLPRGQCDNDDGSSCIDDADCKRECNDGDCSRQTCVCKNGERKDRTCYKGYQQRCSESQTCNEGQFFKCIDSYCACKDPLNSRYDENAKKCVTLVGGKCSKLIGDPQNGTEDFADCVKDAECSDGVCKCNSGFTETIDGHCIDNLLDRGEKCHISGCNNFTGLACIGGVCQCVVPGSKYSAESKSCVASIGSKCGKISLIVGREKCEHEFDQEVDCPTYFMDCEEGGTCITSASGKSYCIKI